MAIGKRTWHSLVIYGEEVIASLQSQLVSSIATASGVGWGMFILIVLLGVGRGMESGVFASLKQFSLNTIWLLTSVNNRPEALHQNSNQLFNSRQLADLRMQFPEIRGISAEAFSNMVQVGYKEQSITHFVKGVSPDYFMMKSLITAQGRAISLRDELEREQVAVLGDNIKTQLFGSETAVGKYLQIGSLYYRVIGVLDGRSLPNQYEANEVFIPFSTLCIYISNCAFRKIGVWLTDHMDPTLYQRRLKMALRASMGLARTSQDPFSSYSSKEQAITFRRVFKSLRYFTWIIGISIVASGLIAVGNTAFVSVNNRMAEIALRKALGATPSSIALLIIGETVSVILLSGFVGICAGLLMNQILSWALKALTSNEYSQFSELQVSPPAVLLALGSLLVFGIGAGIIPADRARKLKPAEILTRVS